MNLTDLEAVSGLEFFPLLFGSFTENDTDDITITKSIADALTDEIRESCSEMVDKQVRNSTYNNNNSLLVALTNGPTNNEGGLSKGRRKKIKQLVITLRLCFSLYVGTMMIVISSFEYNLCNHIRL